MRPVAMLVPGRLDARTGGTIYDRRITRGLERLGWRVEVHELDASFPSPTLDALEHAGGVLGSLPPATIAIIDGLALGGMPTLVEQAASRLTVVALMHLPLASDPAIDPACAAAFLPAERRALAAAHHVVITGAATLDLLRRHQVAADRVTVVEPGTDPAPLARGSSDGRLHLLSVGTLNAGKGHTLLLRALAAVASDRWRLTCAGSLTRDTAAAAAVIDTATELGLSARVRFAGDLDEEELETCYDAADLFVLATLRETYGMAVAEALARGLPVVSTRTGAIPAMVGTDAGIIVEPGDEAALAAALRRVMTDPSLRARLAAGARSRRGHLPTWEDASARMSHALRSLDDHG